VVHRLLAVIGYPAHLVNGALLGPLTRIGLGRLPGALVIGVAFALLTISTASATMAAYDARPEPQDVSIAQIANGRIGSGLWVEFSGVRIDGPQRATVQVSAGGGQATEVERIHYLLADPAEPDRAVVVRFTEPIPALEASTGPIHLDGTITEDPFNMRSLLESWGLVEGHPGVVFSHSRLIAYAFETPWVEPSWIGTGILAAITLLLIGGAFIRQPVVSSTPLRPVAGDTPIRLVVHGSIPTPRGPVRLHGTPAQLEWMNVGEVARTRWRYWGAELGDIRRDVEEAVRAHGREGERLVVHGPTGSVIWPIERGTRLEITAGDAHLGFGRHPALRVRGDGVAAILTFADAASRDAAAAELGAA
jgi:hypothetical protein